MKQVKVKGGKQSKLCPSTVINTMPYTFIWSRGGGTCLCLR